MGVSGSLWEHSAVKDCSGADMAAGQLWSAWRFIVYTNCIKLE